jgi:hypothetical protein
MFRVLTLTPDISIMLTVMSNRGGPGPASWPIGRRRPVDRIGVGPLGQRNLLPGNSVCPISLGHTPALLDRRLGCLRCLSAVRVRAGLRSAGSGPGPRSHLMVGVVSPGGGRLYPPASRCRPHAGVSRPLRAAVTAGAGWRAAGPGCPPVPSRRWPGPHRRPHGDPADGLASPNLTGRSTSTWSPGHPGPGSPARPGPIRQLRLRRPQQQPS